MTEDTGADEWTISPDVRFNLNGPEGPGSLPVGVQLYHGDEWVAIIGLTSGKTDRDVLAPMLLGLNGIALTMETLALIREELKDKRVAGAPAHMRRIRNIIDGHEQAMVRLIEAPTPRRVMVMEAAKPKLWAPGDP